jgi:hypothetical protein
LAKAKREGNDDGVLAFSRTRVGADDCSDEILDHFKRRPVSRRTGLAVIAG